MVEQKPEWQTYKKQTNYAQEILRMKSELQRLPSDARNMTFKYLLGGMYPNLNKITSILIALADTINASMLLDYLKSMRYTANGVDIVERLREARVSVVENPEIRNWFTAAKSRFALGQELYNAADRSNLERTQELLENKDIDLNFKYVQRWIDGSLLHPLGPKETPLQIAVRNMRQTHAVQVARLLINAGANTDMPDRSGHTALMWAAYTKNVEIVRLLLSVDANPNIQGQYGLVAFLNAPADTKLQIFDEYIIGNREFILNWTALMNAAIVGNMEIVKLLLNAGANPTLKDRVGKSARDYALVPYHEPKDSQALVQIIDEATQKWELNNENNE